MAPQNVIVVVSDTLRTAELGCYGGERVATPHLDAFAASGVRFTRAYPESLPTIPVRRALHTGRRAYPFRDYRPLKWDIVYLPGWQAMDNSEDTLAENLAAAGYQTGFVTDTLPYFGPGLNFTRGFWQWEFIRGQQQDRWQSPFRVPAERLARYGDPAQLVRDPHGLLPMHLANTVHVRGPQDTSTARTFEWAMRFLQDNQGGQPFYLLVDCFDPHEPWEAPEEYYRRYGPADYQGQRLVHSHYGPADSFGYSQKLVDFLHAHYCGLVALVDEYFGRFLQRLEELGLSDNTAVLLISDHGTNFCDNPRRIIGKPEYSLYPGVMHLPLLARVPGLTTAGTARQEIVYNVDLVATVYDLAGVEPLQGVDGQSLLPLLGGQGAWTERPYVTCRYGHSVCMIDEHYWVIMNVDGQVLEAFDLAADPHCRHDLGTSLPADVRDLAWHRILDDAGGELPDYREKRRTDAIGQKPAD